MGPIIVFDKSTLESLNIDESVWLQALYSTNITPLFFVETLAALEKEMQAGRTPEHIVGSLPAKTPDEAMPDVHHATMCVDELPRSPDGVGSNDIVSSKDDHPLPMRAKLA